MSREDIDAAVFPTRVGVNRRQAVWIDGRLEFSPPAWG